LGYDIVLHHNDSHSRDDAYDDPDHNRHEDSHCHHHYLHQEKMNDSESTKMCMS
jgi:hypothetical protein